MPLICSRGPFRACGFTLIEAMVALAVLSVGLLGAAVMQLDSLRSHAAALRRLGATHLVCDLADRIRANRQGRAPYDTAADHAHFELAARALFAHDNFTASVDFEPATGPATPDRYVITLRWHHARDDVDNDDDSVALQVLAQPPVAG